MYVAFRHALRRVFSRIAERGMDIFILPHLDSGGRIQTWRNWFEFDPLDDISGYSYEGLVLNSIADALTATTNRDTRVELALSGEMGTSLFRHPESYRRIVQNLRGRPGLKQLKIGISLNHGGIAGRGNQNGAEEIKLSNAGRRQMQSLLDECDFIGMSFYRPVSLHPSPDDFVRGIEHFMSEFAMHGLNVPITKPLHFSEVGIGGGFHDNDVAPSPAKAVESPWAGSGNPRVNPWATEAMRELRREYHRALLEFLATQPAKWNVSAAFFWSTGSWDPQGMRHQLFADAEIVAAVNQHNQSVAAGASDR
jgi:hypothetical protein